MLVNNENGNQGLEWRKFPLYGGVVVVSLMISQCELFSVFSLMVRNLSIQSDAPVHLWLLEGIEWKHYCLSKKGSNLKYLVMQDNELIWLRAIRLHYIHSIILRSVWYSSSFTPGATLPLFCLPLFTASVQLYCYFVCLILF